MASAAASPVPPTQAEKVARQKKDQSKIWRLVLSDLPRLVLVDRVAILLLAWIRVGSDLPVGHPMRLRPSDLGWRNAILRVPALVASTLLRNDRSRNLDSVGSSGDASSLSLTRYRIRILGAMLMMEVPSMCLLLYQTYYQHKNKVQGKEQARTAGEKWALTVKSTFRNLPYAFCESLLFKYFWSAAWRTENGTGLPNWRGFFQHTKLKFAQYGFRSYFFGGVWSNMMAKFWTRLIIATFLSMTLPKLLKKVLPKKVTDHVPKPVQEILNEAPIHFFYFPLIQSTSRYLLGQHTSYESLAHVWFVRVVGDKLKDDYSSSSSSSSVEDSDHGVHRLYEGAIPHYCVTGCKIAVDETMKLVMRKLFKVDKIYD